MKSPRRQLGVETYFRPFFFVFFKIGSLGFLYEFCREGYTWRSSITNCPNVTSDTVWSKEVNNLLMFCVTVLVSYSLLVNDPTTKRYS